MEIELTPQAQRFIEAQLQLGVYRSASEVIAALFEEWAGSKGGSKVPLAELAARQRQRLLQLIEECEPLSAISSPDRLTNRDHDRILYTERP
jgi:Arc/MetJ-type ribon-helix-helix transcriptional regulator